jgi:cold shock protein
MLWRHDQVAGLALSPNSVKDGDAIVKCDGNLGRHGVTDPSISRPGFAFVLLRMRHLFRERKHLMPVGTVKFFNTDKGYGFIAPDGGGADSFVHISAVERAGMSTLDKEQRVSYEVETDQRGKSSAVNLAAA